MDDLRRHVLEALSEYGSRWPAMRFGQLVLAVAESARGPGVESVYDVEDAELLETCRRLLGDQRGTRLPVETKDGATLPATTAGT